MTESERAEHCAKMRSLATETEREAFRREHHERMRERARERGVELPEQPLPRHHRMGAGMQGMGPGPHGVGAGMRGMGPGPHGMGAGMRAASPAPQTDAPADEGASE